MMLLTKHDIKDYELVLEAKDSSRSFHGLFIIHNTKLGPGVGGLRCKYYACTEHAITDGLRLARGMSIKSAAAGLRFGGAKSIIILDKNRKKTPEMLEAYSEVLNSLQGNYYSAVDLGTSDTDLVTLAKMSPYVLGVDSQFNAIDLSYFTAWGCFKGIQAAANFKWGSTKLHGKTIALQGLGSVGRKLAEHLFWAGAKLIVSDIDETRVNNTVRDFGAIAKPHDQFTQQACDILSPCALGGIITPESIAHLNCEIIAGAANNQLANDHVSIALRNRDILYTPDFIINAGGVIAAAANHKNKHQFPAEQCRDDINKIYQRLHNIFCESNEKKQDTNTIATQSATRIIRS